MRQTIRVINCGGDVEAVASALFARCARLGGREGSGTGNDPARRLDNILRSEPQLTKPRRLCGSGGNLEQLSGDGEVKVASHCARQGLRWLTGTRECKNGSERTWAAPEARDHRHTHQPAPRSAERASKPSVRAEHLESAQLQPSTAEAREDLRDEPRLDGGRTKQHKRLVALHARVERRQRREGLRIAAAGEVEHRARRPTRERPS
eukprot:scaffold226219_cov27-Tisochrysis_lutea.AAC.3